LSEAFVPVNDPFWFLLSGNVFGQWLNTHGGFEATFPKLIPFGKIYP
jgi:hypothetical protein